MVSDPHSLERPPSRIDGPLRLERHSASNSDVVNLSRMQQMGADGRNSRFESRSSPRLAFDTDLHLWFPTGCVFPTPQRFGSRIVLDMTVRRVGVEYVIRSVGDVAQMT